jgi:hypothetical protein
MAVFEHLVNLLPREPGSLTLALALIGSLFGLVLWLTGARFSRSILTLAAVALGTAVGAKLPLWCHWSIDGMGPAVGGAVVLGVSAYVLHRLWVGIWLGIVLAAWAVLLLWTTQYDGIHWRWPAFDAASTLPQSLAVYWQGLPDTSRQLLALGGTAAMLAGILAALLWPRIGVVLLWSALGVFFMLATAAQEIARLDRAMLERLPRQTSAQLALLAGMILAGALLQYQMLPRAGKDAKSSKEKKPGSASHQPAD